MELELEQQKGAGKLFLIILIKSLLIFCTCSG
jgi:hypothetical protein